MRKFKLNLNLQFFSEAPTEPETTTEVMDDLKKALRKPQVADAKLNFLEKKVIAEKIESNPEKPIFYTVTGEKEEYIEGDLDHEVTLSINNAIADANEGLSARSIVLMPTVDPRDHAPKYREIDHVAIFKEYDAKVSVLLAELETVVEDERYSSKHKKNAQEETMKKIAELKHETKLKFEQEVDSVLLQPTYPVHRMSENTRMVNALNRQTNVMVTNTLLANADYSENGLRTLEELFKANAKNYEIRKLIHAKTESLKEQNLTNNVGLNTRFAGLLEAIRETDYIMSNSAEHKRLKALKEEFNTYVFTQDKNHVRIGHSDGLNAGANLYIDEIGKKRSENDEGGRLKKALRAYYKNK